MGAFDKAPPNIQIPDDSDSHAAAAFRKRWKWEPHELVLMRSIFTAGDTEVLRNTAVSVKEKTNDLEASSGTASLRLLHRMIVDWTFTIGSQKAPITMENIRRLPSNYVTPLLEICDKLAVGMTQEEQEDFFSSANGHSEENSIEMKQSLFPS